MKFSEEHRLFFVLEEWIHSFYSVLNHEDTVGIMMMIHSWF